MAISKKLKLDKSGGVDIKPDSYIGLLLGVVHLGTQKQTYDGKTSMVDKLFLQFELQDALTDAGNPIVFGKVERNSMKKKANLLKLAGAYNIDMEEGIDFEELVGKPVLLDIGYGEGKTEGAVGIRGYNKLPSVLKKEVKPLMGTPRVYLDVEELTEAQVSELPEFVQKMVKERVDGENTSSNSSDDAIEL